MNTIPPPSASVTPTREGYDQWASCYDSDGNPVLVLEEPHVDRLLGGVRGLSILDVGCGTGRHSIRLARAGAMVHALDFSTGMLQQAREKPGADGISFRDYDLSEPLPFPAETFDCVVCGLVVDHIADLEGLFREMLRVCRPSGCVVVSVMHPAMMLRGVQARFRDPTSGQEVRPASYAHQLSDYVMAAARAGCVFDHLSEQIVSEDLACRCERARKYVGWPMLFVMRLLPKQSPAQSSDATNQSDVPLMKQSLGLVSLVVRDYDEALDFFVGKLGFLLVEDSPVPEQAKRWVVISPPGAIETRLLLARASTPEQESRIGAQAGGRVFLFLHTDNFWRDYARYRAQGIAFVREPKDESYGTVAVFKDLYGNLWDLLQPRTHHDASHSMSGASHLLKITSR